MDPWIVWVCGPDFIGLWILVFSLPMLAALWALRLDDDDNDDD